MADQNQGASIEAERADFEAWLRSRWTNAYRPIDEKTESGHYMFSENNILWEAWQAARRTPPIVAAGAEGLPPLPESLDKVCVHIQTIPERPDWTHEQQFRAWQDYYTAEQMRQYGRESIAHYQRKQAGEVGGAPAAKAGPYASTAADWAEDFAQENGNYENRCADCGIGFMGHKRRTICKVCAGATLQEIIDIGQEIEAGAAAPSDEAEIAAELLAVAAREKRCADLTSLLRRAASEANRFYRGMMNWKHTAEEKDNIIADLRAQLAQTERAYNIVIEQCRDLVNAQLAAKGQGEPVAKVVRGGSEFGPSLAFIANGKDFPKVGSLLYLAAPASAQPADADLEARNNVARALGLGVSHRASFAWSYLLGVIEDLAKFAEDAEDAGAQPDQRESAAAPGISPLRPAIRAIQAIECPYNAKDHGTLWYASAHAWDMAMIEAIRAVNKLVDAAAPSPAAKPAKEGEQPTNNKGESNG
jgi:hypothetical protein